MVCGTTSNLPRQIGRHDAGERWNAQIASKSSGICGSCGKRLRAAVAQSRAVGESIGPACRAAGHARARSARTAGALGRAPAGAAIARCLRAESRAFEVATRPDQNLSRNTELLVEGADHVD